MRNMSRDLLSGGDLHVDHRDNVMSMLVQKEFVA
jgi:hypothetical protein